MTRAALIRQAERDARKAARAERILSRRIAVLDRDFDQWSFA